jgi:hypothetical protein
MASDWNPIIAQGADFRATVEVAQWPSGYPALSTATEWRWVLSQAETTAFLTASSTGVSPMITLNVAQTIGTILVPYATTANFPLGQFRYDIDIVFSPTVKIRLISLGSGIVNTFSGST